VLAKSNPSTETTTASLKGERGKPRTGPRDGLDVVELAAKRLSRKCLREQLERVVSLAAIAQPVEHQAQIRNLQ
jgi:hypothetical protein